MPRSPFREPARVRIDDGKPVLPRLLRLTFQQIEAEDAARHARFRWAQEHLPAPNPRALAGLGFGTLSLLLMVAAQRYPAWMEMAVLWHGIAVTCLAALAGWCLAHSTRSAWVWPPLVPMALFSCIAYQACPWAFPWALGAYALGIYPLGFLQLLTMFLRHKNGGQWRTDGHSHALGVEGALLEAQETGMVLRRSRLKAFHDLDERVNDDIVDKLRDYDDALAHMHRSLREDGDIYHPYAPHARPTLEVELELRRRMVVAYTSAYELIARAEAEQSEPAARRPFNRFRRARA